jgi:hypothetical protein
MRLADICKLVLFVLFQNASIVSARTSQNVLSGDHAPGSGAITFLSGWNVLGPFRIGTRGMEASDPS